MSGGLILTDTLQMEKGKILRVKINQEVQEQSQGEAEQFQLLEEHIWQQQLLLSAPDVGELPLERVPSVGTWLMALINATFGTFNATFSTFKSS